MCAIMTYPFTNWWQLLPTEPERCAMCTLDLLCCAALPLFTNFVNYHCYLSAGLGGKGVGLFACYKAASKSD